MVGFVWFRVLAFVRWFDSDCFDAGNAACVCMLPPYFQHSLTGDGQWMQRLASHLAVPTTAFVQRFTSELHALYMQRATTSASNSASASSSSSSSVANEWLEYEYLVRWFTPAHELPICGHATLACAHVLYASGQVQPLPSAASASASASSSSAGAGITAGENAPLSLPAIAFRSWHSPALRLVACVGLPPASAAAAASASASSTPFLYTPTPTPTPFHTPTPPPTTAFASASIDTSTLICLEFPALAFRREWNEVPPKPPPPPRPSAKARSHKTSSHHTTATTATPASASSSSSSSSQTQTQTPLEPDLVFPHGVLQALGVKRGEVVAVIDCGSQWVVHVRAEAVVHRLTPNFDELLVASPESVPLFCVV